nr:RNA-directed DNA polymerase, eukaryota [Tanacetum cinerariifolium]
MDKVTENCEKEDSLMMVGSSTPMAIKLKIPKEGKRVCSVCKKEFSSGKALGRHMRVHVMYHQNGPFKTGRYQPACSREEESDKRIYNFILERPMVCEVSSYQIVSQVWSIESSDVFFVKSARALIDDFIFPAVGSPTRWVKTVPIKINIFAWKLCLDRLPTRLNLSLRRIIPSINCPICSSVGESCAHLLFSCSMAKALYSKVARWCERYVGSMAKALYSKVARWCEMEIPVFYSYEN